MGIAGTFGEKKGKGGGGGVVFTLFNMMQNSRFLFDEQGLKRRQERENENSFVPKSKIIESYPLHRFISRINTSYPVIHKIDLELIC